MNNIYRLGLKAVYKLNNEYVYQLLNRLMTRRLSKLSIHLSHACNYQCNYCYVKHGYTSKQPCLGIEDWFRVIDEAKALGIKKVSILGGEPLCESYLEKLLRKITGLGMKPYIYTNGSLVTEAWIGSIKQYNPLLIFKYDIDTATYKFHTGQDHFGLEDIEARMRLCIGQGLRVIAFTTLTQRNVAHIGQIIDKSLALGALPAFERYLPVADDATNALLDISDEQYFEAAEIAAKKFQNVFKEWMAAIRIAGRGCGCYSDIISITPNGHALPCAYLPDEASLGNVQEESLDAISKKMLQKKEQLAAPNAKCRACDYRHTCAGGCFTYSYLKKGTYDQHCTNMTAIGFCSYLLADISETVDALK